MYLYISEWDTYIHKRNAIHIDSCCTFFAYENVLVVVAVKRKFHCMVETKSSESDSQEWNTDSGNNSDSDNNNVNHNDNNNKCAFVTKPNLSAESSNNDIRNFSAWMFAVLHCRHHRTPPHALTHICIHFICTHKTYFTFPTHIHIYCPCIFYFRS